MRKKIMQFAAVFLAATLLTVSLPAVRAEGTAEMVRVGLAFGSAAPVGSNLENNTGFGSGYRFGYYDDALSFVELGRTGSDVTKLSVLKAQNVWFKLSGGKYVYETSDNGGTVVGCYHIQLGDAFDSFDAARAVAAEKDGFVAWVNGSYQVRTGAYTSKEAAQTALDALGEGTIVGTSSYAVTVISTGKEKILYQHDGGASRPLGVMPDVTGAGEVRTWCMNYKRYGGFRYERIDGGNLTVANILDMERYIKGVIPYEMNNAWPMEALKTQAVCARSYGKVNIGEGKHRSAHIDVCDTACCQAYHGVGTNTASYQANARTDAAVDETAGVYAWYNGAPIPAYYSSSHGGASEDIYYVWGSSREKYPYLCGVLDPYEKNTNAINFKSSWTYSYSSSEFTNRLRDNGYCVGTSLSSVRLTYSERGNVISVKLLYTNGQSHTLNARQLKSTFGVSSLHFNLNGAAVPVPVKSSGVSVNGGEPLPATDKVFVMSGTGTVSEVDGTGLYVLTGSGTQEQVALTDGLPSVPVGGTVEVPAAQTYAFTGGGNGHQLGMSQYGAYAMAELGFSYDQIVTFYYPGTAVGTNP